MNDFFDYLKNPIPVIHIEKFTFNVYMKIIGLIYFLSFLTSGFIVLFKWIKLLPEYWSPEINSLKLFLAVTLFVPLIEEILFRLNLKLSKLNISAFLAVLTVVFFKLIFLTEMKYGFIYGWLTHSTINFISVILTINKGMAVVLILTVIVLTSYYFFQILQKIFLAKDKILRFKNR